MTTGKRIVELRKAKGIMQKELAAKMGVTASTISMYERDIAHPKLETLQRFAAALECSVSDLVDLDTETAGEEQPQITATPEADPVERMNQAAEKLNRPGQEVAADFVETLTTVPRYQKGNGHSSEG